MTFILDSTWPQDVMTRSKHALVVVVGCWFVAGLVLVLFCLHPRLPSLFLFWTDALASRCQH